MTAPTDVRPTQAPQLDDGTTGPEEVAHIVDQREDKQSIPDAYVFGTELTALCGYRWVPHKDPEQLPVCLPCVKELERIRSAG